MPAGPRTHQHGFRLHSQCGMELKSRHTGMKISEAEFDAMAEDVVKAMNKFNVPAQEQSEV